MKKYFSRLNNTLFDVASGPFILAMLGVPIIIVIVVVVLIVIAVKLIKKANQKNQMTTSNNDTKK